MVRKKNGNDKCLLHSLPCKCPKVPPKCSRKRQYEIVGMCLEGTSSLRLRQKAEQQE